MKLRRLISTFLYKCIIVYLDNQRFFSSEPNHFTSVPNLAAKLYVVILSLITELRKPKGASTMYPDSKNHLDEACEIYASLLMDQTMMVLQTFWDQLSLGQSGIYVNWGVISMESNLTGLEAGVFNVFSRISCSTKKNCRYFSQPKLTIATTFE